VGGRARIRGCANGAGGGFMTTLECNLWWTRFGASIVDGRPWKFWL